MSGIIYQRMDTSISLVQVQKNIEKEKKEREKKQKAAEEKRIAEKKAAEEKRIAKEKKQNEKDERQQKKYIEEITKIISDMERIDNLHEDFSIFENGLIYSQYNQLNYDILINQMIILFQAELIIVHTRVRQNRNMIEVDIYLLVIRL